MDPADSSDEPLALSRAQARGAEEVGSPPPASDANADRMPPWIPRLLLLIVLVFFTAYAAFTMFRRLRDLIVWLITAPFLRSRSSPP
jgi:hypothetical protein